MDNNLKELVEFKKMQKEGTAKEHLESRQGEAVMPKTFKEKWENYWYHYAFVTFLVAFVTVIVILFAKDMIFKPRYDFTLNIATKYSFSAVNEDMAEIVKEYVSDYDENGKISVYVDEFQTNYDGTSTNPTGAMVGEQKILAVLHAGSEAVFVFDEQTYNAITQSSGESIFEDLSLIFPESELIKEDRVLIGKTELGKKLRMNTVKSDIHLCVRKFTGTFAENEKNVEKRQNAFDFINNIIK